MEAMMAMFFHLPNKWETKISTQNLHIYRKCKLVINTFTLLCSVSASTIAVDQFVDSIYMSQMMHAICVDTETQHYRRLLSTDGILTRGTMYWQLVRHSHSLTNFYVFFFAHTEWHNYYSRLPSLEWIPEQIVEATPLLYKTHIWTHPGLTIVPEW